jgi:hypothetical protein
MLHPGRKLTHSFTFRPSSGVLFYIQAGKWRMVLPLVHKVVCYVTSRPDVGALAYIVAGKWRIVLSLGLKVVCYITSRPDVGA